MSNFRYLILFLSLCCLTFMFSNSLALNFTVICMDDVVNSQSSNITADEHWLRTPSMVNSLFSAIAIGSLIGTLPVTIFIQKIGVRWTMTIYGLLSAGATILLPLAVSIGFPAVFLMRVLQGVGTALSYPATGLIASQWSTVAGMGVFLSIVSCYSQFSSIFTMPIAGFLCETSLGWSSLYYLQGIITLIVVLAFAYFYRDTPSSQSLVGAEELEAIQKGKEKEQKRQQVPYRAMCRDSCMIAIIIASIGINLGFFTFLQYGPTYMNKVLNFDIRSTGFVTALPYVLSAISKFVTGHLTDKVTCISERNRILFFAILSQGGMAAMFLIVALTDSVTLAQIAYTAAIVFSGLHVVGHIKCAQKVARQHVHFVMAIVSLLMCATILLLPIVVSFVCPDNSAEQWSRLFISISIIIILSNIPFVFLARSESAMWTVNCSIKVTPSETS